MEANETWRTVFVCFSVAAGLFAWGVMAWLLLDQRREK